MLELDGTQGAAPADDLIKDATDQTFMADVVDASQEVPVIVDFWAPWCGPCKTLGPALEAAVQKARGKVRMVKVNVDENQGVAGQLRVQSIPTVYAFHKGQPVDGFQGALPPSQVEDFVQKMAALGGDDGLGEALEAAEQMLVAGDAAGAAEVFAAIAQEDPASAAAFGGMVRAHLALGQVDQAEAVLNGAPAELHDKPELEAARAALELARQAEHAGPVDELRARVDANPDDHQARFDLATALNAAGDTAGAVDQLLDLFRRDRDWNDGAARTQLFTIFDALKPNDPVVLNGRRRLSSMIFV
ncbi:MAG: thioredoxin [Rhodobacteraceae bacterium HLUCCA08]|nr:MAG: thioredoxin [Rhodobacteraceae bacterium HLUCCA08]